MKEHPTTLCATRNMTLSPSKTVAAGEVFEASSPAEARYLVNINKARVATDEDQSRGKPARAKAEK